MTIEAFWCVSFHGNLAGPAMGGFGVVIFESGKIYGGDSNFYFNGSYILKNEDIKAEVKVKRFAQGMPSITGLDDYTLVVERLGKGNINGQEFMIEGHVAGAPQNKVYVGFRRIEDLP